MKILHTADFHLSDRDIEEAEKCLDFLIETARIEAIDLIVIAGDVFDSQDVKLDSLSAKLAVKTVSTLADIAPVAIVLGTPSHDGKAAEILRYVKAKFDIHVASRPQQVYLEDGFFFDRPAGDREPECIVSFVPPPTKQFLQARDQDVGQAMSGIFAGFGAQAAEYHAPHVLVGHFTVSGAWLSSGQQMIGKDIEIGEDQIALANAQLILCGHLHLPQVLHGKIFYAGSLYPVDWGEQGNHGFYIHEIEGEVSGFIETPCRKMVRLAFDSRELFIEDFLEDIFPEADDAHVRIDVTAWQDEAGGIDKELISDHYKNLGALDVDIRIIRIPREIVRAEAVLKAESLRDKVAKMAEMRGEEVEWSVLAKAESLEGTPADELIEWVTKGAPNAN